jgi:hypothetical protein
MFEKYMHNYEIKKQSFVLCMVNWQLYMCLGMLIIEYFGDEQWKPINGHVLWSWMEGCITFLKHIYQSNFIHFHKYENLCTILCLHSTWFQLLALQNYEKCFLFTRQVHPNTRMYMAHDRKLLLHDQVYQVLCIGQRNVVCTKCFQN